MFAAAEFRRSLLRHQRLTQNHQAPPPNVVQDQDVLPEIDPINVSQLSDLVFGEVSQYQCDSLMVALEAQPTVNTYCRAKTPPLGMAHLGIDADVVDKGCCHAVEKDFETGVTLAHVMKRHYCTAVQSASRRGRPMRVLQVGANTGGNANDPLHSFLKLQAAHALLVEPVPHLFQELEETYKAVNGTVKLLRAAVTSFDGVTSFIAPRRNVTGWWAQMGGIRLEPIAQSRVTQYQQQNPRRLLFRNITVGALRLSTVLRHAGWLDHVPDVFVVDAEGYDERVLQMLLLTVHELYGPSARIPIIQWEWKFMSDATRHHMWWQLAALGYCVMEVCHDDIAVYRHLVETTEQLRQCSNSFNLTSL